MIFVSAMTLTFPVFLSMEVTMATADIRGIPYFYKIIGHGAPVLFAHCLTWNHREFDAQVAVLAERYTLILADQRGHGQTGFLPEPYTLADMVDDLYALLQRLGIGPVHYVGHSMGAMMGPQFALSHPDALRSLALIGGSANAESGERLAGYRQLIAAVRAGHHAPVAEKLTGLFFGQTSRQKRPEAVARFVDDFMTIDGEGLHWTAEAVFVRPDLRPRLPEITQPALMMVGEADAVTSPDLSRELAAGIPNSRLLVVPEAGHFLPVEAPNTVTGALIDFWETL
jgi:pimeloyl-ACP methyl ester carboxylesterase